jgi:flagellar protein FlgJ
MTSPIPDNTLNEFDPQTQKLQQMTELTRSTKSQDEKKLRQTSRDFEAIFVNQLLDAMDKTIDREDSLVDGGRGEEIFRGMLNENIAKSIANHPEGSGTGFGIAEAIYKQASQALKTTETAKALAEQQYAMQKAQGNGNQMNTLKLRPAP